MIDDTFVLVFHVNCSIVHFLYVCESVLKRAKFACKGGDIKGNFKFFFALLLSTNLGIFGTIYIKIYINYRHVQASSVGNMCISSLYGMDLGICFAFYFVACLNIKINFKN